MSINPHDRESPSALQQLLNAQTTIAEGQSRYRLNPSESIAKINEITTILNKSIAELSSQETTLSTESLDKIRTANANVQNLSSQLIDNAQNYKPNIFIRIWNAIFKKSPDYREIRRNMWAQSDKLTSKLNEVEKKNFEIRMIQDLGSVSSNELAFRMESFFQMSPDNREATYNQFKIILCSLSDPELKQGLEEFLFYSLRKEFTDLLPLTQLVEASSKENSVEAIFQVLENFRNNCQVKGLYDSIDHTLRDLMTKIGDRLSKTHHQPISSISLSGVIPISNFSIVVQFLIKKAPFKGASSESLTYSKIKWIEKCFFRSESDPPLSSFECGLLFTIITCPLDTIQHIIQEYEPDTKRPLTVIEQKELLDKLTKELEKKPRSLSTPLIRFLNEAQEADLEKQFPFNHGPYELVMSSLEQLKQLIDYRHIISQEDLKKNFKHLVRFIHSSSEEQACFLAVRDEYLKIFPGAAHSEDFKLKILLEIISQMQGLTLVNLTLIVPSLKKLLTKNLTLESVKQAVTGLINLIEIVQYHAYNETEINTIINIYIDKIANNDIEIYCRLFTELIDKRIAIDGIIPTIDLLITLPQNTLAKMVSILPRYIQYAHNKGIELTVANLAEVKEKIMFFLKLPNSVIFKQKHPGLLEKIISLTPEQLSTIESLVEPFLAYLSKYPNNTHLFNFNGFFDYVSKTSEEQAILIQITDQICSRSAPLHEDSTSLTHRLAYLEYVCGECTTMDMSGLKIFQELFDRLIEKFYPKEEMVADVQNFQTIFQNAYYIAEALSENNIGTQDVKMILDTYIHDFELHKKDLPSRILCSIIMIAPSTDLMVPLFRLYKNEDEECFSYLEQEMRLFASEHFKNKSLNEQQAIIQALIRIQEKIDLNNETISNSGKIARLASIMSDSLPETIKLIFENTDICHNNPALVLAAIKSDPSAFEYVHDELKQDRAFAIEAIKQNPLVIYYLRKDFIQDPEIQKIAINSTYKLVPDEICKIGTIRYFPKPLSDELKTVELPQTSEVASWRHLLEELDIFIKNLDEKDLLTIRKEIGNFETLNQAKAQLEKYKNLMEKRISGHLPYLGTPPAGSAELEEFYENIETNLRHLDDFFSREENKMPVALIERLQVLQTQSACGARFQSDIEQLFALNCLSADQMRLDQQIALIASSQAKRIIETMVSNGDVHEINILNWQLHDFLVGQRVVKDHLGHLVDELKLRIDFSKHYGAKMLVELIGKALMKKEEMRELFDQFVEENISLSFTKEELDQLAKDAEEQWEESLNIKVNQFSKYLKAKKAYEVLNESDPDYHKAFTLFRQAEAQFPHQEEKECQDIDAFKKLRESQKAAALEVIVRQLKKEKLFAQYYDDQGNWKEELVAEALTKMGILQIL